MDGLHEFLDLLKRQGIAQGNFLGLLNVLIGRRIESQQSGTVLSGVTWRQLAVALKRVRWEKDAVRELHLDPRSLPPRDRERYWYSAIAQAHVDSPEAKAAGDQLALKLGEQRYRVTPGPG